VLLSSILRAAIGLTLGTSLALAQGGPPLETDDPGTPGSGKWELNTALTLEHTSAGSAYEAPLADLNYGLGERIQLTLEIPLLIQRGSDRGTGLGDPGLAVKWRFLEDSAAQLAVSIFPRVEFESPLLALHNEESGSAFLLPVEMTVSSGRLGVNGEAGYRIVQDGANELIYRVALGYQQSPTLGLLSECTGASTTSGSATEIVCQLGTRKDIGERFTFLGAFGTRVAGNIAERTELRLYLGLQSRW
jgi:hypothetical protein